MAPAPMQRPQFVVEDDAFLQLWPQRFDFLYATHPDPKTKPDWKTESRYPLADRLIRQGTYLYGVRFAADTRYAMLDIDAGSPYHPRKDVFAMQRMMEALEPVGLVRHLLVRSSDSGGLHLYLPFDDALPSWKIGLVLSSLLENAGFKVMPGWLEVFPNQRHWSPEEQLSLFNGHRLPLQQGSYLLNADFEPIASSHVGFVQRWGRATTQNSIDHNVLEQVLRTALRRNYRVSSKAAKFLNDLQCEIESGWNGRGQTNRLLGRIALRSYIFGHVLYAATPLTGDALVADIVQVAKSLPGFEEWCRHQHELETRAKEWAQAAENNPRYYPYSHEKAPIIDNQDKRSEWNEQQKQEAIERIQKGIDILTNKNLWPDGITARYDALVGFGVSGSTLYKHRSLWHPLHTAKPKLKNNDQKKRTATQYSNERLPEGPRSNLTSLLPSNGCNPSEQKALHPQQIPNQQEVGCNSSEHAASGPPQQLKLNILEAIAAARVEHEAHRKRALSQEPEQNPERRAAYLAQLRAWEASGDPILAEAGRDSLSGIDGTP